MWQHTYLHPSQLKLGHVSSQVTCTSIWVTIPPASTDTCLVLAQSWAGLHSKIYVWRKTFEVVPRNALQILSACCLTVIYGGGYLFILYLLACTLPKDQSQACAVLLPLTAKYGKGFWFGRAAERWHSFFVTVSYNIPHPIPSLSKCISVSLDNIGKTINWVSEFHQGSGVLWNVTVWGEDFWIDIN